MFKHLGISIILLTIFSISTAVIQTARGQDDAVVSFTQDSQVIQRTRRPSGGVTDYLPHAGDEILVRFKETASAAAMSSAHSRHQAKRIKRFRNLGNLELVKIPRDASLESVVKSYLDNRDVLYAEPNYVIETLRVPNDTSFSSQWNLHNTGQNGRTPAVDIKAVQAWDITTGSSDVVVAVIDSGVDYAHQDLAANMWRNEADCNNNGIDDDGNGYIDDCYGIDAFNNDSDPMDDNNHGTHVAGIIGAVGNNGIGITGINWDVRIMACKFIGADGFGTVADAIECLNYVETMKRRGANVIATSNSWGSYGYSQALYDVIESQRQGGLLFIAAAGNDGFDSDFLPVYPANFVLPNVLSVGGTTPFGHRSMFSNYGKASIHVFAPAEGILSTTRGNTYSNFSGTSVAAPHVAGIAALLKAQSTGRDWNAIKNLILAGGDDDPYLINVSITGKKANAYKSLTCSNAVAKGRLAPREQQVSTGLRPVDLAVLHVNCAIPNGEIAVTVSPSNQIVVLQDNGIAPDQLAGDGIYSGQWLPPSGGTFTLLFPNDDNVTMVIDTDLELGFPVKTLHTAGTYQGGQSVHTLVGNIDDDPNLEIVVTGVANGPLYAWKSDGSRVAGWPVQTSGAAYAVMGEFSPQTPGYEVFAVHYGDVRAAYLGSGAFLGGWPQGVGGIKVPVAVDLDRDGIDEIVLHGTILKSDGSHFPGSPFANPTGTQPAVVDLDGDGVLDIITTGWGGWLFAHHQNGNPMRGFPVPFSGTVTDFPAIGDVDGDGKPEIVVIGRLDTQLAVIIVSNEGTIKRSMPLTGTILHGDAPALADLDGDGLPEIIAQVNEGLYVFRGDGSTFPGWPVMWGDKYWLVSASPVVGDVDGDGLPDIVVITSLGGNCCFGEVRLYNRNGTLHGRFPKTLKIGSGAVPAIADIDRDGRNEIIVTGQYWDGFHPGYHDKVWVFDLGGPPHGFIQWGQFMGGPKHQGVFTGGFNIPHRAILNVRKEGTGSGTVISNINAIFCGTDCSEAYNGITTVTLIANAGRDSVFTGWSGAGCQGTGSCSIVMTADTFVTAVFIPRSSDPNFRLTAEQVQFEDVNGDGRADYLSFDLWREAELWVGSSNQSDFGTPQNWLQHGESTPDQIQYADVNGDGKADALYFDTSRSRGVWVSVSTGIGFTPAEMWLQHGESLPDQIKYVDVNGDRKADALYFDTLRSKGVWVSLSTGSGFTAPEMWVQYGESTTNQLQYADIDGNGKADALYFDAGRSNCVFVSLSTGHSFSSTRSWLCHGPSTSDQIQYADVNGDGKADVLYFDTLRSRGVWVSLSTTDGFTPPELWLQHGESTTDQIQYADVNGDKKADALYFDTSRSRGVWVSLSIGSGFMLPQMWLQHGESSPDQIQYVDVNGDGKADAIYFDVLRSREVWVSLSNGSGFIEPVPWPHAL